MSTQPKSNLKRSSRLARTMILAAALLAGGAMLAPAQPPQGGARTGQPQQRDGGERRQRPEGARPQWSDSATSGTQGRRPQMDANRLMTFTQAVFEGENIDVEALKKELDPAADNRQQPQQGGGRSGRRMLDIKAEGNKLMVTGEKGAIERARETLLTKGLKDVTPAAPADPAAKKVTLSLTDARMGQVAQALTAQTGVPVSVNFGAMREQVSIEAADKSPAEVLDMICKPKNWTWKLAENGYTITAPPRSDAAPGQAEGTKPAEAGTKEPAKAAAPATGIGTGQTKTEDKPKDGAKEKDKAQEKAKDSSGYGVKEKEKAKDGTKEKAKDGAKEKDKAKDKEKGQAKP